MPLRTPDADLQLWKQQCTAPSRRTGNRCRNMCAPGLFVCFLHGGRAPQVQRKAAEVMKVVYAEFAVRVAPALQTIDDVMLDPKARNVDKLKAVSIVLQYGLSPEAIRALLPEQDERARPLREEVAELLQAFIEDRDPEAIADEVQHILESRGVEFVDEDENDIGDDDDDDIEDAEVVDEQEAC